MMTEVANKSTRSCRIIDDYTFLYIVNVKGKIHYSLKNCKIQLNVLISSLEKITHIRSLNVNRGFIKAIISEGMK